MCIRDRFCYKFLADSDMKKFSKLVNMCQSYEWEWRVFWLTVYTDIHYKCNNMHRKVSEHEDMHVNLKEIHKITTENTSEPTVLPSTQVNTLSYYHKKPSDSGSSSFCRSTEIQHANQSQRDRRQILTTVGNWKQWSTSKQHNMKPLPKENQT